MSAEKLNGMDVDEKCEDSNKICAADKEVSAAEIKTENWADIVEASEVKADTAEDSPAKVKAEDCSESNDDAESKEKDFIVRIRGLPWSSSKDDIVKFFSDCKIKDGVNGIQMTLTREGRPNGGAFVEFESQEDLDKAQEKDNQNIGQRYIEVFRCKKKEMRTALRRMGIQDEKDFNDACVRLRGIPYECSKEEIAHFFAGLQIVRNGITLPVDFKGRSRGNAYVQFASEDIAEKAMEKHKQKIGHRYIEIFKSSLQEIRNATGDGEGPMRARDMDTDRFHPYGHMDMLRFGGPEERMGGSEHRVRMRGVPYKAKRKDIAEFFRPVRPVSISVLHDSKGRPSGEADVEFPSHRAALKAMRKHKEKLLHRFVRLYLYSEPEPFRREVQPFGPQNGHSFESNMDMELGSVGRQMGYYDDVERRFEGYSHDVERNFGGYYHDLDRRFEGGYGRF